MTSTNKGVNVLYAILLGLPFEFLWRLITCVNKCRAVSITVTVMYDLSNDYTRKL